MGILDSLLGNASEVDPAKLQDEFKQVMADGEQIEKAYQLFRDSFLFTSKRLILVDKQGLTGSKTEYHSLPYRNITHFSIETGSHFDLDAELKIWIAGASAADVAWGHFDRRGVKSIQCVHWQALPFSLA